MDYRINEFKKYLIDEVKSKSFLSYPEILREIESFSKTKDFRDAYEKWIVIKPKLHRKGRGPKHILG